MRVETRLINLDRRPERLAEFWAGLPTDWPFGPPVRVRATDGAALPIPARWKELAGAWGCYRSHVRCWENLLERGAECGLILEDDAVFAPGFVDAARAAIDNLPADWHMLYLGCQHLTKSGWPPVVAPGLVRCIDPNRTHAYLANRDGLRVLYRELADWPAPEKGRKGHVDYLIGQLVLSGTLRAYACAPSLVGQRHGASDVCPRPWRRDQYWQLDGGQACV